jgi:FkbM family methyltransferase
MKTIVEVGGHKGTDTVQWTTDPDNIVFVFEPNPAYVKRLNKIFNQNKNVHIIAAAVDLDETDKKFNISAGVSSLHEFSDDLKESWPDLKNATWEWEGSVNVQCMRLDTLIKNKNITKIDYLWIDAQGNDFNVLKSLGDYISIVQEGRCEAAYNIALYKNTINDVESICTWLTTHNFEYTVVPDQWNKEADIHFKKIV